MNISPVFGDFSFQECLKQLDEQVVPITVALGAICLGGAAIFGYLGGKKQQNFPQYIYTGGYSDGQFHGEGKVFFPDKGISYEGNFAQGRCIGTGRLIFKKPGFDLAIIPQSEGRAELFFQFLLGRNDASSLTVKSILNSISDLEQKVVKIQSLWRGYLVRCPLLPKSLRRKSRELVKSDFRSGSKKAEGGRSAVYLPREIPEVVIKDLAARKRCIATFSCSQLIHELGIKHLIVPQFWQIENYHVAGRLDINIEGEHNLFMYYSNPSLFDKAVKDFVLLRSKCYIPDLLLCIGVFFPNMPFLMIENEKTKIFEGKIGLIDVEDLELHKGFLFEDLATMFPKHVALIKDTAASLNVEVKQETLDHAARIAERRYNELKKKYEEYAQQKASRNSSDLDFCKKEDVLIQLISKNFSGAPEFQNVTTKTILDLFAKAFRDNFSALLKSTENSNGYKFFDLQMTKIKKEDILCYFQNTAIDCTELLTLFLRFLEKNGYIFSSSVRRSDYITVKY